LGTNWLRGKKPGLKAWVTSASWGQMNTDFMWQLYINIYPKTLSAVKVDAKGENAWQNVKGISLTN